MQQAPEKVHKEERVVISPGQLEEIERQELDSKYAARAQFRSSACKAAPVSTW